jgi:hypothetical protein
MSVNFCDNSGIMAGIDLHMFYLLTPPNLAGTPTPMIPHVVAAPMLWPPSSWWNRTGTVKSDNWKMIQDGFTLYLVLHVPIVPLAAYGGLEPTYLAMAVIGFSTSSPLMSIHSVTGEGSALATCVLGGYGINKNCGQLPVNPAHLVNLSTVKTTPSIGDYLLAALGVLFDKLADKAGDKILDRLLEKVGLLRDFVIRLGLQLLKALAPLLSKGFKALGLPDVPSWITDYPKKAAEWVTKELTGEGGESE